MNRLALLAGALVAAVGVFLLGRYTDPLVAGLVLGVVGVACGLLGVLLGRRAARRPRPPRTGASSAAERRRAARSGDPRRH